MLPHNASPQSHQLLEVAKQLTSNYPLRLADAIIIIGSVARGKADHYSDLDISFLVESYPELEACKQWIKTFIVTELRPMRTLSDGQIWMEYEFEGHKLNFKWQSWDSIDSMMQPVRDVVTGKIAVPQNNFMLMHWILQDALVLHHHQHLQKLKEEVQIYPENLRRKVIENVLSVWEWMSNVPVVFAAYDLATRGEIIDIKRRQLMGLNSIMRVLYAHNRLWMPDDKCLMSEIELMTNKPDKLEARITSALTNAVIVEGLRDGMKLMIDTLALLKEEFEVDKLMPAIRAIADYDLTE